MRRRIAVFWAVPLLLLALSALVSSRALAVRAGQPQAQGGGGTGSLLIEVSRRPAFTLGFRNLLADLVWLQAVQISSALRLSREEIDLSREDYDRFSILIRSVTNFDPKFDVPYLYAGILLGESPAHAGEALSVLEAGKRHLPGEWRLPFYAGYIHYFTAKDPVKGGKAIEEAARVPGSPAYLSLLASRMLAEGREPEAALSLLEEMIRQESDPGRLRVLERRLREVVVERDIQVMERAAEEYRMQTGTFPATLSELVFSGLLAAVPPEPNGGRYFITPSGEVRSDMVMSRLRVIKR
jgi:hypothetical protein